ncbi:MAG: hypothetical protein ENTA_02176 [Enterocloster clostridioformis]|uniref:helix-turn-helix transcriptional regulator n=1 Tax=Akkermansia muciniphila TaxID=239935 RepID=UPI000C99E8AA|nr:YafY family protein [Akkermansia muciniphila]PNC55716.1 transcriptional regulator [Akkermansia muciniphila]
MKLYRLLHLMNILVNNDKVTIKQLSEKLEVSRRTIYRDLETLTMAGFPIVSYPGYDGGITVAEGYKLDKCLLSLEDWENILTGLNTIKTMGDTEKIEYLIGKIAPKNIETINQQSDIVIDLSQWYDDEAQDLIVGIRNAISNKQLVSIEYISKISSTVRTIEPYKLVFKERDWYVYAYCLLRMDFRLFKLNRISAYEITTDYFVPRQVTVPSFALKNGLYEKGNNVQYRIALEFALENKEFLLQALGALNFKITDNKGIIDFITTNLDYMVNLIISLQDKVKVVSPPILQERVLQTINKMKKIYEG